jgi:hypothetical protein
MANTESVIQPETEINHVAEDKSTKEDLTNETINNIHTFLFDILAFFSNYQSSLIAEYCQEPQNVCRKYFFRNIFVILFISVELYSTIF